MPIPIANEARNRAVLDIVAERERQPASLAANDDKKRAIDWVDLIKAYAGRAIAALRDARYHDTSSGSYRSMLVKVGALALAAIEAQDRKTTP